MDKLKQLEDCSVDCCVTSPPYYGLRDYGTAEWIGGDANCDHLGEALQSGKSTLGGRSPEDTINDKRTKSGMPFKSVCGKCGAIRVDEQIGLEETPEEYIAKLVDVFREVRRVLRDDGTLWVNIADSYSGGGRGCDTPKQRSNAGTTGMPKSVVPSGCKPKDLIGIPWKLAEALKSPYYSGRIKNELDRVWLAAMIDAEGSICGFVHTRKDDGSIRTGVSICITNSDDRILQKAFSIYPLASRHAHQKNGDGHLGNRDIWRWYVFGIEAKQSLLREIYPYLVAKRKQAIIAYNFLEYQKRAKQYGHTAQKQEVLDLREKMMRDISSLNHGIDIDIPSWMSEPPSLYIDGWYLRQEIIWSKPNPMPESVTDRCTKSHESIFLLAKSSRYYYDAKAIAEPTEYPPGGTHSDVKQGGFNDKGEIPGNGQRSFRAIRETRNKRDVWTMSSQPFSGAHFATFPMQLPENCILAGCRIGGTVLDPFNGAGTTGIAAMNNGRNYIGIDLNAEYLDITRRRFAEEVQYAEPLF